MKANSPQLMPPGPWPTTARALFMAVAAIALTAGVEAASPSGPSRRQGFSALAALYDYPGEHPEAEELAEGALGLLIQPALKTSAQGENERREGRYSTAAALYEKAFALVGNLPNPDMRVLGAAANNLGAAYQDAGRYKDAARMYSIALGSQAAPADVPVRAITLANQASLLDLEGDYLGSKDAFDQALALMAAAPTVSDASRARALNNYGVLYHDEGYNPEAETELNAALQLRNQLANQAELAETIDNLGNVYRATGRYEEAKFSYETALGLRWESLGEDHPDYAGSLNDLANFYRGQYDYGTCGPLYEQAKAIWQDWLPPTHPVIAGIDKNLAALYDGQGNYGRAEEFYQRALEIRHQALGERHPLYAASLRNLATFYAEQERADLALRLYEKALAIEKLVLPKYDPDIAATMVSMGDLYRQRETYQDAEQSYREALDRLSHTREPSDPNDVMVASAMADLGQTYADDKQYDLAERQMLGALDIRHRRLGFNHPDVARSEVELADFYDARGRFSEAEGLLRDAIRIHTNTTGEDPTYVARINGDLAHVLAEEGKLPEARLLFDQARRVMIETQRNQAGIDDDTLRAVFAAERGMLRNYAQLLAELAARESFYPKSPPATDTAFEVVEQAKSSAAQAALAMAATRWAAANPDTAHLVVEVQSLRNQRQALARSIAAQAARRQSPGAPGQLDALLAQAAKVDQNISSVSEALLRKFPKYAEIANPVPIGIGDAVALLKSNEALISFFTLDDNVMAWFLRRDRKSIYRVLRFDHAQLAHAVENLRESIENSSGRYETVGPYDVADAYLLYRVLLAPFEAQLTGVTHLIIVPDDVLIAIPFAALVTNDKGDAFGELAEEYRTGTAPTDEQLRLAYPRIAWLVKQPYTTSEVPSATALSVLRSATTRRIAALRGHREARGYLRLIGVGDPVLRGECARTRGGDMVSSDLESETVEAIRDHFSRLCGARQELLTEAAALDAPIDQSLYMGPRATKPQLVALNHDQLGRARIVVFATHALTGGFPSEVREPALVMTPPEVPTPEDNGLLSLTDIVDLHLTWTDWVILSACNTFSTRGGGEGFNGLARAFFHAGAPSILASQWSVDDQATRDLMTRVLTVYARANLPQGDPMRRRTAPGLHTASQTSRAEALRQGELSLITAENSPAYFAHPYAWAPFVVVGEGGPVVGE
jgi:CHAT domain-containing protein